MLSTLVVFAISAAAIEVTLTYSEQGYDNMANLSNVTTNVKDEAGVSIANITYQQNDGTTPPTYYQSGNAVRLYKISSNGTNGSSITITPENDITITKVAFTFSGTKVFGDDAATGYSKENSAWTGSTTTALKFVNTSIVNQVHIQSITITYTKASTGPDDYLPNFAAEYNYMPYTTEAFAIEGDHPALEFTSDNDNVDISLNKDKTGYEITTLEECQATITVTWPADEKWNASSEENPVTFKVNVAKKIYEHTFENLILEEGESKVMDFGDNYPKGSIIMLSREDAIATVEENTETGVFTIKAIAAGETTIDVAWGDDEWSDGQTEFTVTVTKALIEPELRFSATEATEYIGALEAIVPELTAPEGVEVSYESSKPEVATVDAATGAVTLVKAGTTTITATSKINTVYKAGEASYTLTVKDAPAGSYNLMTSLDELVDGAVGVIGFKSDQKVIGAFNSSKSRFECVSATFVDDMVSWTENVTDVVPFTFHSVEGGYTIEGEDSKFVGATGTSTDLTYATTETPNTATIKLDQDGAKIQFAGYDSNELLNNNGYGYVKNYASSHRSQKGYTAPQIYLRKEAPATELPTVKVNGVENAQAQIKWEEGMTIHFEAEEGVRIYRNYEAAADQPEAAPQRVQHEGKEYERHTEAYEVPGYGTVSYFAEKNGVRSEVKSINFTSTTGIEGVSVSDDSKAVYYDITGRRVENPSTGLYIRVNGDKATKVIL